MTLTSAERNAVEAAIYTAAGKLDAAKATAATYDLAEVVERLTWAADFTDAALEKLSKEQT